jgi:hypothetical protein
MRVQILFRVNNFNMEGWVIGVRTLEFIHEFFQIGIAFINSATELFLDVVHFGINGINVKIWFLIGFILASRSHLGMRGCSINKK